MQVQEVLRMTDVAPVPYVMGIVNLRGNVVTVLDTRKLLDRAISDSTDPSRTMIIESSKVTLGLLVDSVVEVVNSAASEIDPPANVGNNEGSRYIQGVDSSDQQVLILIDLNKRVNAENRAAIGMFSSRASRHGY